MQRRSPARFLAPLALLIAVIAVFVVARPQDTTPPGPSTSTATPTSTSTAKKPDTPARSSPKPSTYTVKPGDTLSGISKQTGVPVATILDLNAVDAKTLRVGQKLKLRG